MTPSYRLPRQSTRIRARAQQIAYNAVKQGRIPTPTACAACGCVPGVGSDGRTKLTLHHPDYDRPLFVVPLCAMCHRGVHAGTIREPVTGRLYPSIYDQRRIQAAVSKRAAATDERDDEPDAATTDDVRPLSDWSRAATYPADDHGKATAAELVIALAIPGVREARVRHHDGRCVVEDRLVTHVRTTEAA